MQPPASTLTSPANAVSSAPIALRLEHVSFTYADSAVPALHDVSLEVRQGEMVVIMGASGAGKSTLVKCCNRVIPAFQSGRFSGTVSLFGRRLINERVGELAGTVGMVLQDFEAQVFATTVRDEIVFGMEQVGIAPAEMHRRLAEVLAQVGLVGFESRDPASLSGGEKQRLALAAILALRPRLLILDEPTTDLDPQGRQQIFMLLRRLRAQGYTLVVVEHDVAVALEADRLAVLANGQLVAVGPPDQLLPHIETLTHAGVRPHDFDRLFRSLGIHTYPRDIEGAVRVLRAHGISLLQPAGGSDSSPIPVASASAPQSRARAESASPLLQLEAVSHWYSGAGAPAITGVTLTITTGEFIALLGANGSGKTTLAKHCSGLLTPTQGQIFLHGRELRTIPLAHLAQEIGYVFQNPDHQLFAATVEEEVAFGLRNLGLPAVEVHARVSAVLETVGLHEVRGRDPFLLDKGERQRLAVAAVLALHPRLLILDEPTTGLDYREQRTMMELLRRLHRQGHTILIITHVPWVAAEYAERALVMARGHLVWDGPLRELCRRADLWAQAAFHPPDITRLGLCFNAAPLSVEECLGWVGSAPQLPGSSRASDC
ncbi:MAG: energy-coupling factor transporter ATPase [Candidatus Binatia bacterium]|nr:energy-coupling factor transporter ATPase [Candidatus Binatia bacterium]